MEDVTMVALKLDYYIFLQEVCHADCARHLCVDGKSTERNALHFLHKSESSLICKRVLSHEVAQGTGYPEQSYVNEHAEAIQTESNYAYDCVLALRWRHETFAIGAEDHDHDSEHGA